MTRTRFAKLLRRPLHLLAPEWEVEVLTGADLAPDADGQVLICGKGRAATVLLGKGKDSEAERVAWHEACHLLLWPVEELITRMAEKLPEELREWVMSEWHEREDSVVLKLERAFVELSKEP